MQYPNHVREHVETIAKHEYAYLANAQELNARQTGIAAFIGSFSFVVLHLIVFFGWITFNITKATSPHYFDPNPFALLDTCVALEAILLASFILMRQSGLAKRADERDHLMLQILLLSEKEISAVVRMNQ